MAKNGQIEFLLSVADVLLIDKDSKAQLASATLKTHNMNQTVDTTEIRAGQRNDVLATIKNNKTIEITIEDVQQQRDFIAMMLGAEVEECSVDIGEKAIADYYIISCAEASSNLSRYDGVKYGYRTEDAQSYDELIKKTRSEGFGNEVKRRILLGNFVLILYHNSA